MPSVQYYNRTAPFWDFVASLEDQSASHPFFNRGGASNTTPSAEQSNPWADFGAAFPFRPFPHRGRHNAYPQPPEHPGAPTGDNDNDDETMPEVGPSGGEEPGPSPPPRSGEPDEDGPNGPRHHGHHHDHHHGPHRHGHHGRGGHGLHGRGGRHRGRGGFGGCGRGDSHPYAAAFGPFGPFAEMLGGRLFRGAGEDGTAEAAEDFKPEVDVFDTAEAFVVHVSLPGAKKEDVGVSWDTDKSELTIAGVVHRPGDEDFLKTLALGERSVGAFDRKVRLGSRANPAQIDIDGITAKMEDGVLRIDVPKLDSGFVEIRKVDIQ